MLKLRLYIRSFQNLVRSTLKDPETLSESLRGLLFLQICAVLSRVQLYDAMDCSPPGSSAP